MIELLLIAVLAGGPVPFEVQTLDGQKAAGQIVTLNAQVLELETDAGRVAFPLAKLAVLAQKPAPPIAATGAELWVELIDGAALGAVEYTVADGKAKVRLASNVTHEFPTKMIRTVRFGSSANYDPKMTKQWSEIGESKAAGDLLVVRKNGALDYLEGVLGAVDADTCQFEVDGEVIPVKRPKVEGLVYAPSPAAELPEPIGKLVVTDGSRLPLHTVELDGDQVSLSTPAGSRYKLPLAGVVRFDFSSGKIAYLSDLEPESVEFTPLFGFQQSPPGLLEYYAYRRDVGFAMNPLRLDGKVYQKGLALASRTKLAYKLPGKFRVFHAMVGIDDSVRETGSVKVEIKGDGKVLWQADVRGSEPARELELEIAGVKRLEVVVDYGEGLDVGDRLDLAEAQVTK
ncbi:MAG: NPCBM/NEW2 domain-containing protein [Pirellulales bacterium]